jgi:hypothetical protein
MTLTLPMTLLAVAFLLTLVHAITGKVPVWIPVLLIIIALCAK